MYAHLALILELSFLRDSHVSLFYPPPKSRALLSRPTSPTPSSPPTTVPLSLPDTASKPPGGNLSKHPRLSIWSLLTRKTEELINNMASPTTPRPIKAIEPVDLPSQTVTVSSDDTSIPAKPSDTTHPSTKAPTTYRTALSQVTHDILSTSPRVSFPPPALVARLAERERDAEKLPLASIAAGSIPATAEKAKPMTHEKVGLTSVVGWSGAESLGHLGGTNGFLRHQVFTALYSETVSIVQPTPSASSLSSKTAATDQESTSASTILYCTKPSWRSYHYFSRDADICLGDLIRQISNGAAENCGNFFCGQRRADHDLHWIHSQFDIIAQRSEDSGSEAEEDVAAWIECTACETETERKTVTDATSLLSFGKFLELLLYSPSLPVIIPPLCLHTTPSGFASSSLGTCRLRQRRCFSYRGWAIKFSVSVLHDIFEIRVPKLHIKPVKQRRNLPQAPSVENGKEVKDDNDRLRLEITHWWKDLKNHLEKLVSTALDPTKRPLLRAIT